MDSSVLTSIQHVSSVSIKPLPILPDFEASEISPIAPLKMRVDDINRIDGVRKSLLDRKHANFGFSDVAKLVIPEELQLERKKLRQERRKKRKTTKTTREIKRAKNEESDLNERVVKEPDPEQPKKLRSILKNRYEWSAY